jgi:hypothetical protein
VKVSRSSITNFRFELKMEVSTWKMNSCREHCRVLNRKDLGIPSGSRVSAKLTRH